MEYRGTLAACVAAVGSGLLISFILHHPDVIPRNYSDITAFWGRAWVSGGLVPYVSEVFEYPPVSGFLLYFSRMVGGDLVGTYDALSALIFAAAGVMVWACWRIAKMSGRELRPMYFILPSFLVYGIYNFDVFHAMFVMLSLYALLGGRREASGILLGLAISTKLASGVLLPVYLLEFRAKGGMTKFLASLVGVVAAINIPLAAANFGNWYGTFTYIGNWGLEDAWYVWIFQDPSTWAFAKIFGFSLMGLLLIRAYTLKADATTKSFLAIAAYLLGTYIYSPQFNILLIPLVAVLTIEHPSLYLWEGFNAMVILTWFIPTNLPASVCPNPSCPTLAWTLPQGFALLRAAMLAWMVWSLLRREGWSLSTLVPWFWDSGRGPVRAGPLGARRPAAMPKSAG